MANGKRLHSEVPSAETAAKHGRVDSLEPLIFFPVDAEVKLTLTSKQVCEWFLAKNIGRVQEIRVLRDGNVLVRPSSPEQRRKLVNWSVLCDKKVAAREPLSLNPMLRKKILNVPLDYSEAEILAELQTESNIVQSVHRLGVGSKVVRIDFSPGPMPDRVFLFCQSFRILPFEERGRLCRNCQCFGHIAANCRGSLRCSKCGEGHASDSCTKSPACFYCHGKHPAGAPSCPRTRTENVIKQIQLDQRVSYAEAAALQKARSAPVKKAPKPSLSAATFPELPRLSQASVPPAPADLSAFIPSLLAFVAEVLNVTLSSPDSSKSSRVNIVAKAAKRHFGTSILGAEIHKMLTAPEKTPGSFSEAGSTLSTSVGTPMDLHDDGCPQ